MPTLRINNKGANGLADRYWNQATTSRFGGSDFILSGSTNPFLFNGYITPANKSFTNLTNIAALNSSPVAKFLISDDNVIDTTSGTSIYFGQGALIHAANPSTDTISYPGSTPYHTIAPGAGTHSAHATFAIDDLTEYQLNGSRQFFVSYRDNTDGDVTQFFGGAFLAAENTFSASTGGAVLSKVYPIILVVSDNGFMYVLNANLVHKFDGTSAGGVSGAATLNVLQLSSSQVFVDGVDGLGKLWLAVKPAATIISSYIETPRTISVLVWNRISSQVSVDDNIRISDCSDIYAIIFGVDGIPYVFTRGSNAINQLRRYNGRTFEVVKELGQSNNGRPANRGAITTYMDGILWTDLAGNIMWYGKAPGASAEGLFVIAKTVGTSSVGAMVRVSSNTFYSSYDSSGMKVAKTNLLGGTTAIAGDDIYLPRVDFPKLTHITGITFYFLETAVGTANTPVNLMTNPAVGFTSISIPKESLPNGFFYSKLNIPNCNHLQVYYSPNGAEMQTTFQPYAYDIHYELTKKVI